MHIVKNKSENNSLNVNKTLKKLGSFYYLSSKTSLTGITHEEITDSIQKSKIFY
jgi:hypothetical protein